MSLSTCVSNMVPLGSTTEYCCNGCKSAPIYGGRTMSQERISAEALKRFIRNVLEEGAVDALQADAMADILLWGELVGRPT